MIAPTLAQEISQLEAELCFALADPSRILMLYALEDGPHNVTELGNTLGITQPTTSRHLKILRDRGLVQPRREGAVVNYHLYDRRILQALDLLRAVLRDRLMQRANLMEEIQS